MQLFKSDNTCYSINNNRVVKNDENVAFGNNDKFDNVQNLEDLLVSFVIQREKQNHIHLIIY